MSLADTSAGAHQDHYPPHKQMSAILLVMQQAKLCAAEVAARQRGFDPRSVERAAASSQMEV